MQFHEKKLIYLISRVFLPGLFKMFWLAVPGPKFKPTPSSMFYHFGSHSDPGPRDRRRFQKRYGRFDYYDNDYDYDYYSNNNRNYDDFITASKSDQYSGSYGGYGGGGGCCGGGGGGGGSTGISNIDAFLFLGALAFAVAFLNSQIAAILGKKRRRRKKRSSPEMEFSSLDLRKIFFCLSM